MSHYLETRPPGFVVDRSDHPLRFFALAEEVVNRPGTWSSERIRVFDRFDPDGAGMPREIGAYVRNYRDSRARTFAPFMRDGQWYALYSRHYTATRIMKLPSMEDVGGEEPASMGFCPVELWVPRYRTMTFQQKDGRPIDMLDWHQPHEAEEEEDSSSDPDIQLSDWAWSPVGFVAGCHWGDDTSWKIEAFDLRRAGEGAILRYQPLGYLEMGGDSLSASLDLEMLRADGTGRLRIRTISWEEMKLPEARPADEASA